MQSDISNEFIICYAYVSYSQSVKARYSVSISTTFPTAFQSSNSYAICVINSATAFFGSYSNPTKTTCDIMFKNSNTNDAATCGSYRYIIVGY